MGIIDIARATFIIAVGVGIGLFAVTAFGLFSVFVVRAIIYGL